MVRGYGLEQEPYAKCQEGEDMSVPRMSLRIKRQLSISCYTYHQREAR